MRTIGRIGDELHLRPRTIRYYEAIGLLPRPRRSESGYRLYSQQEVERLRFIKSAKQLGLSLAEIRQLMEHAIGRHCADLGEQLLSLVGVKLREVEQRIGELTAFKNDLKRYYDELSQKRASKAEGAIREPPAAACGCIGELAEARSSE